MVQLREYLYEDGGSPFAKWFDSLEPVAAAKVATAKTKLSLGHVGNVKPLDEGVCEYRIDYGPGYRIYLAWDGAKLIVLLGGGDKGSQKGDIAEAKRLWAEYKRRKVAKKQEETASMKTREDRKRSKGRR